MSRPYPEPGQVWEHSRGRHVGARFEVLWQVEDWPDWWVVRSLTAKDRATRESYWPDLSDRVRLVTASESRPQAPGAEGAHKPDDAGGRGTDG